MSLASVSVRDAPADGAVIRLDSQSACRSSMACKVCSNNAFPFDVVDLNKQCSRSEPYPDGFSGVSVTYYRCRVCGAIFSPSFEGRVQPDLPSGPHAGRDNGAARSDGAYASREGVRHLLSNRRRYRKARVLAYGIGARATADELSRHGYRYVEAFEPASGADQPDSAFDIVLAVDCIEHTLEPVETVRNICRHLAPDGCIVLEQELQPDDILAVRANWWYIGPRTGHVCTYSADTLASLAQGCGLTFYKGATVHGFGGRLMSPLSRQVLSTIGRPYYFAALLAPAVGAPASTFDWRCWSQGEVAGAGGFRWSLSGRLTWPLPELDHLPATLRLLMPFCDRITPEFLQGVHVYQGWFKTDFHLFGANLVAEIQVTKPMSQVHVDTSPPVTPYSVRGDPDYRPLGIAVLSSR